MSQDRHGERRHRFAEGQGFGNPYRGFSLEVQTDGETYRIDPTDDHALADLLDTEGYRPEDVDLDALLEVGLSYLAIEQYEQAAATFARVAWFAPEESREAMESWVLRGVAHAQVAEYDEAVGAAREALRIDGEGVDEGESRFPDLATAAESNLAYALWESGDSSHPLAHAERAAELDPRSAEAWYDLGFYYSERSLWEFAVEALERALALGLRTADVHEELALAREELQSVATEPEAETSERKREDRTPTVEDRTDTERLGA